MGVPVWSHGMRSSMTTLRHWPFLKKRTV